MTDIQDTTQEFRALEEKRRGPGLTPEEEARLEELRAAGAEEPTGVLWERGPVEQPAAPLPELVSGSPAELAEWGAEPVPEDGGAYPPLPPPDPAYAAVAIEEPGEPVLEIGSEDVQEVVDPVGAVVAVTLTDADAEGGEVVSLDALVASGPPAGAEALSPPLPPPLPHPAPAPPVPAPDAGRDPFAASPSFVSGEHRIVLHTVEGQVLRGSIANADLADEELPLVQPNGAVARVPAHGVKAIFFMLPGGERPPAAAGTRIRVTFADGRQVAGLSPDYTPDSAGFFVLPLDTRTHTARVWVYRTAARQITVG